MAYFGYILGYMVVLSSYLHCITMIALGVNYLIARFDYLIADNALVRKVLHQLFGL